MPVCVFVCPILNHNNASKSSRNAVPMAIQGNGCADSEYVIAKRCDEYLLLCICAKETNAQISNIGVIFPLGSKS